MTITIDSDGFIVCGTVIWLYVMWVIYTDYMKYRRQQYWFSVADRVIQYGGVVGLVGTVGTLSNIEKYVNEIKTRVTRVAAGPSNTSQVNSATGAG